MKRLLAILMLMPIMAFPQTGDDIARMMDERKEPVDMVTDMTMILTSSRGQTRTLTMHTIRKGEEKQLSWFLSPADDRGVAFLKIEHADRDDEMRMWLPAFKRMRRISSSKKGDSFMGSDLSFEDMTSRQLDDYSFKLMGEETIDGEAHWILESTPKPELRSSYSKMVSWIRQRDIQMVKEEKYNRAGTLAKIMTIETVEMEGYVLATRMFVTNVIKNHTTELIFDKIAVDTGVKDSEFHERNLKRLPK